MRILHVLDHSLPLHSGYTFRTRAILKAQIASGMEVQAVTGQRHVVPVSDGATSETHDGLLFHRTAGTAQGPGGLREWREINALAARIAELANDWRPDVIHAHSPALCGMAALKAARQLDIPLVYEIRAFWEDAAVGNGTGSEGSIKYRLTRGLENRVVAGADAVFTICNGLRDDLVARGFDAAKIGIMPNGVDLSLFGETLARDDALASELGIGEGPVLGFIGSFYDYEGLDDLVAAMPRLLERVPDARLLLIGGGPMEAAIRAQAAALPCAQAIVMPGRVPHDEVRRFYSLCDVMVYPRKAMRLTETVTPLKPLEAMAQRKLVAASAVGGHRELLTHGKTGTLFAPDSPEEMADALANLLETRDGWEIIRATALAHVRDAHDWATNARCYQDVYQLLLAGRTSRTVSAAA